MLRAAINAVLGAGYLAGFLVVWIGIRLIAFAPERSAAGLLGIAIGIAWWSILVWVGKRLRTHAHVMGGAAETGGPG